MEIETKQNGAERPADFVPPPTVKKPSNVNADFDAKVLSAIGKGLHFTTKIAQHLGVFDTREINNALRRLKSQGKIRFLGQAADKGWRKIETVPMPTTKKVTKKRGKKDAQPKTTRVSKKRHHVHCVLPQDLYRHVTTKAKDKTFTQALIDALTKVYGRP